MLYILTLTWNNKDKLTNLYNSIKKLNGPEFIWLIRDNNSEDGTENLPWLNDSFISYNRFPSNNESFSAGNNYLYNIAKAKGLNKDDFVLLLNDDIVFKDSESLNKMIKMFDDNKVGIVGSRLEFPDGSIQHGGVVFVENSNGKFPDNLHCSEEMSRKNREVQAVTGACLMVRAAFVFNVLLDEAYHFGFEDIDLSLRIKSRCKKIMYCGETNIIHDESSSLKKNSLGQKNFFKNLKVFRKWDGKFKIDGGKK